MIESCHMYDWVTAHVWMSNTTRMNESCRAHSHVLYGMPPIRMYIPLIRMCDVTYSCVRSLTRSHMWYDVFIAWHDWRIHKRDRHTSYSHVWYDVFMCFHMCDMTHSYVWHDSIIHVTWLNHTCDIPLIHMCDMTYSCVWDNWLVRTCDCRIRLRDMTDAFTCVIGIPLIHMCDMMRSYVWHGWLMNGVMTHSCVWCDRFISAALQLV